MPKATEYVMISRPIHRHTKPFFNFDEAASATGQGLQNLIPKDDVARNKWSTHVKLDPIA